MRCLSIDLKHVWICTSGRGVLCYNTKNKELKQYVSVKERGQPAQVEITDAFANRQGDLFFFTTNPFCTMFKHDHHDTGILPGILLFKAISADSWQMYRRILRITSGSAPGKDLVKFNNKTNERPILKVIRLILAAFRRTIFKMH